MTGVTSDALGPWFRRHPRLAVAASLVLFALIFIGRFAVGDERDATSLLYVLPIALIALAFGFQAGISASAAAVASLVIWVEAKGIHLSVVGWLSRSLPLLLLGGLIGLASDSLRRAEVAGMRLALAEERQREAAEINDTIVQNLAVAKWRFEDGSPEDGIAALETAMHAGEVLVTGLLASLETSDGERRRAKAATERSRHFDLSR